MTKKTPIKIIKRDERNRQEKSAKPSKPARVTAQETARDMVANVSNWVSEFQQKRRAETSQAFKTLFPETPRASEAKPPSGKPRRRRPAIWTPTSPTG